MKTMLCYIFIMVFTACAGDIIPDQSNDCTHCYLVAGQTLTYGDFDSGVEAAEELKNECPECWPPVGRISSAIFRDNIDSLITVGNPQTEDFDICSDMTCVVHIKNGSDDHYMYYDYDSGLFFDTCNCRSGCYNNYEIDILYASSVIVSSSTQ